MLKFSSSKAVGATQANPVIELRYIINFKVI